MGTISEWAFAYLLSCIGTVLLLWAYDNMRK